MSPLPNLQTVEYESRLLVGNPMGNPYVRRLPVYLPPGYDAGRVDPYPVIFMLTGWGGRGARFLNEESSFAETLPDQLDRLIGEKRCPPAIVVFPDGSTKLGASQYINSAANGPFMDYVCDELVGLVDGNFHTHKNAAFRGVMGHSSGGFGALVTGMLRPDTFQFVLSSAGDAWYEFLYTKSIPAMINILAKAGGIEGFVKKMLASPNPLGLNSRDDGETLMNLSMCTCYAPNPDAVTIMGDLWFDLETGDLVPEVWEKFLSWDPIHMVDRQVDNLKKLGGIRLEAGSQDEYGLHIGHRRIAKKLKSHGIDYSFEEYPGRHSGHHWRNAGRIQWLVERMLKKS